MHHYFLESREDLTKSEVEPTQIAFIVKMSPLTQCVALRSATQFTPRRAKSSLCLDKKVFSFTHLSTILVTLKLNTFDDDGPTYDLKATSFVVVQRRSSFRARRRKKKNLLLRSERVIYGKLVGSAFLLQVLNETVAFEDERAKMFHAIRPMPMGGLLRG